MVIAFPPPLLFLSDYTYVPAYGYIHWNSWSSSGKAKSWRPVQQDAVQGLPAPLGGQQEDAQALLDFGLPDELAQPFGPERILIAVIVTRLWGDHPFAHRVSIPVRFDNLQRVPALPRFLRFPLRPHFVKGDGATHFHIDYVLSNGSSGLCVIVCHAF